MTGRTGQCLCGEVKFELASDPVMSGVCHCKNCQRQAGSAFSTLSAVPRPDLNFTSGTPKLFEDSSTKSGGTVMRYFCGRCGSPLYSETPGQPGMAFIKSGTLDDTSDFAPQFHVWCDSKQSWVELEEGIPAMAQQ